MGFAATQGEVVKRMDFATPVKAPVDNQTTSSELLFLGLFWFALFKRLPDKTHSVLDIYIA